jgi:hypothetical protein
MKDSKKYTDNLNKFWKKQKPKGAKLSPPQYEDPVDALLYATIREFFSETATKKMLTKLSKHFVDWNDMRVSRFEEIIEVLGGDDPVNRTIARTVRKSLNSVFEANDCISLDYFVELGKRKAKEELDKMESVSNYVAAYIILCCMDGHAIPINQRIVDFLKDNKLVHPDSDISDIQGFVERIISTSQGYLFFETIRTMSEGSAKSAPVKAVKKTAKKTTKKKTTKKKALTKRKTVQKK